MSPSPPEAVRHILDEIAYLRRRSDGLAREAFFADETLQRAFVRSLEVVGEAAKHVPDSYRERTPEVDWRGMAGLRDRLIHGYFGVNCASTPPPAVYPLSHAVYGRGGRASASRVRAGRVRPTRVRTLREARPGA